MKLNKYIKGDHIIEANEKAYRVIYKEDGYIPYEETIVELGKKIRKKSSKSKDVE